MLSTCFQLFTAGLSLGFLIQPVSVSRQNTISPHSTHLHAYQQGNQETPSVPASMHVFQTMIETYAVDWGGVYPNSVAELRAEATAGTAPYWKELKNPLTGETGEGKAYLDFSNFEAGDPGQKGLVLYKHFPDDQTRYEIVGVDEEGWLYQQEGQDYLLSNS